MENKVKIDPFKGVVKPDDLRTHMQKCAAGENYSRSYVRGALHWLQKKPPNPYIVPLLQKVLEKYKCESGATT